ncbi:MAG: hypothetical protein RBR05_06840 [Candidatus Methanomethylophilaceae archaeon]|nr:hypothetical protein [Candidatus Methanomethylophilaceae archaeon]MDY0225086.1 hypothetical protein [Candidatus Methanomethylophilaceae archaeon]
MNSKKIIITTFTILIVSILIACTMAPAVDADETKTVDARTMSIYQGSTTAESVSAYSNYSGFTYFFNDGSSNEKIFLNYIQYGTDPIPTSDDNGHLIVGSTINIYYCACYDGVSPYIYIIWANQYQPEEIGIHLLFSAHEFKYYFEEGSTGIFKFEFGNNINCALYVETKNVFHTDPITSGVDNEVYFNYPGSATLQVTAKNMSGLFTTITYTVSGNYDPSSDNGNGALIIMGACFVLFIVGLSIIILSAKKPDWSK